MSERLTIVSKQCPGDFVVMTAMLRDLHRAYPGHYQTMVKTLQDDIFLHNPYASHFAAGPRERSWKAQYSNLNSPYNIHRANNARTHFMWGFIGDLNLYLGTKIILTEFKPDLYLTDEEKRTPIIEKPYWLFSSGGKSDFPAKIWDRGNWSTVVKMLNGRVKMVQVGGGSHIHPPVQGAIDLVSKTTFRELMRLIYHSEGVICAVTCFMHVAAAFNKPCVVIAGGREGWWWEAYTKENRLFNMRVGDPNWNPASPDNFVPHHYLHTIGKLECCMDKGCWNSVVTRDSGPWDGRPATHYFGRKVCTNVDTVAGRKTPHCLQTITPADVLLAVEWYYAQGILSWGGAKVIKGPALKDIEPSKEEIAEYKELEDWVERSKASTANCILGVPSPEPEKLLLPKENREFLSWRPLTAEQAKTDKYVKLEPHPLRPGVFKGYFKEQL